MSASILEQLIAKHNELQAGLAGSEELQAQLDTLHRERERYREHGFGLDVLLQSGTYSFSSVATFDTVVEELRSREFRLHATPFHFVCRPLPTTGDQAMLDEDGELVHLTNDKLFDSMKRAYEVAGWSALPVCVYQPLAAQRAVVQHKLRDISSLVPDAPTDKLSRVQELLHQAEELLRAGPTSLTDLKSHAVVVIGNDPTENANTILRATHTGHSYRSGLMNAFGLEEAEAIEIMESWAPASRNVASTRKEDGGLRDEPLRRDALKLIRHIVGQASERTTDQSCLRVLGCGKLFDLMMQFNLDPKSIHETMFDPRSSKQTTRFQEGGNLHKFNLNFNASATTLTSCVQMMDESSNGTNIRLVKFTRGDEVVTSCYIAVVRHPGSAKRSATNAALFDTGRLWRELMSGATYFDDLTVPLEYLDGQDEDGEDEDGSDEDNIDDE